MVSAVKRKEREVVKWSSWWGYARLLMGMPCFALLVVRVLIYIYIFFKKIKSMIPS